MNILKLRFNDNQIVKRNSDSKMKQVFLVILVFGAYAPSVLFSQNNNRISLQTGLFHSFFDQTPIVNSTPNPNKRTFRNLFGGMLTESIGLQYQRLINLNSSISVEFMSLSASYSPGNGITPEIDPMLATRNIKTLNITYLRNITFDNHLVFLYGGGTNYRWGHESIYLYSQFTGWGWEPRYNGYYRNDFGLNLRTGIEYSPKKWITLYTNIDFSGIIYLGAKDLEGESAFQYYKEKYGRTNIPSRYDLSWNFGIGFNF